MNKRQFLEKLQKNLSGLPKEEIDDVISDFEEYFEIGSERNRSEEDILKAFGDPKLLAQQIKAESFIKKAEQNISSHAIIKAVFTTIGLSFFNLIVILPVFLLIVAILGFLFLCAVSIGAMGLSGTIISLFYPLYEQYLAFTVNSVALVFASIGTCSLGILFFVGDIYLAKFLYRKFLKYLRFNARLVRVRRFEDEI